MSGSPITKVMTTTGTDDFQTPHEAMVPLFDYIPKSWVVWDAACGQRNIVEAFIGAGYMAFGSDIRNGRDYLDTYAERPYDVMVTNPPFSLKNKFLRRAYDLGKPFAFLLPITTLETAERQEMFRSYGVELIIPNKRINFTAPDGKYGSTYYMSAWFTNGLNIGRQLVFYEYPALVSVRTRRPGGILMKRIRDAKQIIRRMK